MKPYQNILSRILIFVKKEWLLLLTEFLLLSFVFALGFVIGSKIFMRPPLIIDKDLILHLDEIQASPFLMATSSKALFVASVKGKYYYPLDCPLVETLSEKNKIYFSSKAEAEAKGYIYNNKCDK